MISHDFFIQDIFGTDIRPVFILNLIRRFLNRMFVFCKILHKIRDWHIKRPKISSKNNHRPIIHCITHGGFNMCSISSTEGNVINCSICLFSCMCSFCYSFPKDTRDLNKNICWKIRIFYPCRCAKSFMKSVRASTLLGEQAL